VRGERGSHRVGVRKKTSLVQKKTGLRGGEKKKKKRQADWGMGAKGKKVCGSEEKPAPTGGEKIYM